jgi:hypothetical protein
MPHSLQAIAPGANRSAFFSTMSRVFGRRSSRLRGMVLLAAFCIMLTTCQPARAEQANTIDLRSVTVPDLCRVIFKEMLHADYILSPEVIASEQKLTLSISNQPKPKVLEILKTAFAASGFMFNESSGVYLISKAQQELPKVEQPKADSEQQDDEDSEEEIHTYKIKARPIAYLAKIAKFAGAKVGEVEEGGGYLIYSATEETNKKLEPLLDITDTPSQAIMRTFQSATTSYSRRRLIRVAGN